MDFLLTHQKDEIREVLEGYVFNHIGVTNKDLFIKNEIKSIEKMIGCLNKLNTGNKDFKKLFKDIHKNIYNSFFDIRNLKINDKYKKKLVDYYKNEVKLVEMITDWHKNLILLFGQQTILLNIKHTDDLVDQYLDKLLEFSYVFTKYKNNNYAYLLKQKGYFLDQLLQ